MAGDRVIKEALHIKRIMVTDKNGIRGELNLARFPGKTEKQIIRFVKRNGYTRIRVVRE